MQETSKGGKIGGALIWGFVYLPRKMQEYPQKQKPSSRNATLKLFSLTHF